MSISFRRARLGAKDIRRHNLEKVRAALGDADFADFVIDMLTENGPWLSSADLIAVSEIWAKHRHRHHVDEKSREQPKRSGRPIERHDPRAVAARERMRRRRAAKAE